MLLYRVFGNICEVHADEGYNSSISPSHIPQAHMSQRPAIMCAWWIINSTLTRCRVLTVAIAGINPLHCVISTLCRLRAEVNNVYTTCYSLVELVLGGAPLYYDTSLTAWLMGCFAPHKSFSFDICTRHNVHNMKSFTEKKNRTKLFRYNFMQNVKIWQSYLKAWPNKSSLPFY